MNFYLTWANSIILTSIFIYFVYGYFDGKQVKDEREEMIRLRTYEFVQRANIFALLFLSAACFFVPRIHGMLIISILILSSLYTEIVGKIYYRRKL